MTIHFICRGNTYRSRLAETYLNSKNNPKIQAISSGIEAKLNDSGPITWYAQRIIQKEGLQQFEKPMWEETTKELLTQGDFTVFMQKDIYDFCVNTLGFSGKDFEVWDIQDLIQGDETEAERIKETENTYAKIKEKVDLLTSHLQATSGKI